MIFVHVTSQEIPLEPFCIYSSFHLKAVFRPSESECESEKDQRTIGRDQRKKF